ncbi:MAG: FecR domain-containing protein [Pseudomonadota bacterium]
MKIDQHTKLLEDAALIFVQLREAPADEALLAERDAFLARGPEARAAYDRIQDGWQVSGGRARSRAPTIISLLLAATLGWYFGVKPVQDYVIADAASGLHIVEATLNSGDLATLDADTALVDDTADGPRSVRLLRGAALFDVASNTKPFIVTLGDAEVRVRGTVFETAFLPGTLAISVAEGSVDVSVDGGKWTLSQGQRLEWTDDGQAEISAIDPANIASWRADQLVVTDARLDHVVEAIDRRLRGDVMILGSELASMRVSGRFDLGNPASALRVLSATVGADLYLGAPLGSVIVRTD